MVIFNQFVFTVIKVSFELFGLGILTFKSLLYFINNVVFTLSIIRLCNPLSLESNLKHS